MKIALFIGRFQPFHKGHLWAVKEILRECDSVIIGIGSSQFRDKPTNPFSGEERKEMIVAALESEGIKDYSIFLVPDIFNDSLWPGHVKEIVGLFDSVYTGSELTEKLFLEEGCVVKRLPRHDGISSTEVRLKMQRGMDWECLVPESVAGIIMSVDGTGRVIQNQSSRTTEKKSCL